MSYAEIQAHLAALEMEASQQRAAITAAHAAEQVALAKITRLKAHLAAAFAASTSGSDFSIRLRARVDADPEAQRVR